MPIACDDASLVGVVYAVDRRKALALLPTDLVEPLVTVGRALALVVAFDYRQTGIGPYGELGLAILAKCRGVKTSAVMAITKPASVRRAGWFVVNLPVTTELALAAGVEIYGYPKYLSRITSQFAPSYAHVVLNHELEIDSRGWRPIAWPAQPIVTLTQFDDRILRTQIEPNYNLSYGGPWSTSLRIIGDGPCATTANQLGLHCCRPLVTFRTDHMRSSLPAGELLGEPGK